MRPNGVFVSVPLTLLQAQSLHLHDTPLTSEALVPLVPLNMLLAHSVYDWDRAQDLPDGKIRDMFQTTTDIALFTASFLMYSNCPEYVPFLYILQKFYNRLKPRISSVKPFFVALCWTFAVYWLPLAYSSQVSHTTDIYTPSFTFLQMVAWSHFADIKDIEEDKQNNAITPAVRMGVKESKLYTCACLIGMVLIHTRINNYAEIDKLIDFLNMLSFAWFATSHEQKKKNVL